VPYTADRRTTVTATAVDVPIINVAGSLAGFPDAHRFALVRVRPDTPLLFRMVCLDLPGLEFVAAAPFPFFPEYAPEIDDETAERLELTSSADAVLLVLLTVGPTIAETTANLFAPIVVNVHTGMASQVPLVGSGYSLREPLRRPA